MRFSSILALAATIVPVFSATTPIEGAAIDTPLLARSGYQNSGAIIAKSVTKVKQAVDGLDAGVLNITTGDINLFLPLLDLADTLNTTLYAQTAVVKKLQPICAEEADYVQTFVVQLIKSVQKVVKDLIAVRQYAIDASVYDVIPVVLGPEKDAADLFANALISKVPASKKALAKSDKKKVDDALDKALTAYAPMASS